MMKKLVIFDLDGTLLNSIADLASAVNFALKTCGYPLHSVDDYRYKIGNGLSNLLLKSLPENDRTEENAQLLLPHFIEYYSSNGSKLTKPYNGICELLTYLQDSSVKIAVASNKYHAGTVELVNHYFPAIHFVAIFGQRDGKPVKPDPSIVLDILDLSQLKPEDAIYVGDSGVDMQTAINAKVDSVGVTWGFRTVEELSSYSPDFIIDTPLELLTVLDISLG